MFSNKNIYSPPVVDYKKRRKSVTIPDQSMSIREIVKRYVRGVPVDVIQRDAVYIDQSDYDLEKMSRMDFGEKQAFAERLKAEAESLQQEWRDAEHRATEAKRKAMLAGAEKTPPKSDEGAKA